MKNTTVQELGFWALMALLASLVAYGWHREPSPVDSFPAFQRLQARARELSQENAVLKARLRPVLTRADVVLLAKVSGESHDGAEAVAEIAWRESRFRPDMDNPESSSSTLNGFLDSTWGPTGISKTKDPLLQILAMVRYNRARYGGSEKALGFHRRNGWY